MNITLSQIARRAVLLTAASLLLVQTASAQIQRNWVNSAGATGVWLSGSNWTPSGPPARWAGDINGFFANDGFATDLASFGNPTTAGTAVGIDMGTAGGSLTLAGISFNSTNTAYVVGNSSAFAGVMTLNTASINTATGELTGTSNFIVVSDASTQNATIQNVSGAGSSTLGIRLGVTSGGMYVTGSRTLTLNAIISQTTVGSGFTKTGAGTLVLGQNNSYSGVTSVNAGTLTYGVNDAIFTGGVTVSGGNLNIASFSDSVGVVTLQSGSISGTTGVLTGTSYAVQSGTVSAILGGGGGLTKTTAGTVDMSKANTYTGATVLNQGIVNLTGSLASGSAVSVNSTATLNVNGGTVNGATTVATGGNLNVNASGIANNVTVAGGNVNVNASGTVSGLTLNSGIVTLASSSIVNGTVNMNGGSLNGTGTMNGPVTVLGGTVRPGTSPGTLTVNNSFTMGAGATLEFDLNGVSQAPGGLNDLITVFSNLTLDGTLNVVGAGSFLGANFGDKWLLFNYTGSLFNNGLTLGTTPTLSAGYFWVIDTSTANQVNLMAVPEPGSAIILMAGMAGLIFGRRRRVTV